MVRNHSPTLPTTTTTTPALIQLGPQKMKGLLPDMPMLRISSFPDAFSLLLVSQVPKCQNKVAKSDLITLPPPTPGLNAVWVLQTEIKGKNLEVNNIMVRFGFLAIQKKQFTDTFHMLF